MTASTILTSFSGISDPGNYPPENALAVGPESIVTAESVPYEVTNLSGGAATTGSQFQLFSSLGPTLDNSVFDTRAAYDSSTGRFVLIANNLQPGGTATNIDIAISKDSNPADGWFVASIDTSNGGTTQSDMPCLSVSDGSICITAPEFSGSPLVGSGEWVVSESSIASGSPQILASATTPAADAIMRSVSANGVTYYVSAQSNASQTQLTYQTYSAASGFSAPQTLMFGNSDQGPIGGDYAAQQAGTSLTLDAGDARIESLAYANGYLYGVSETLPTGASAPEIHWFKLDVSNPASPQLVIQGDLSGSLLGDPNIALFNASIAVDGRGDVLINFTASGPNMDPSDYYVVQGAQDSSFGTPTLYQASTSYFQQTPGATGMQRWGTYSSAVADPASQGGFWISNEYVTSTGVTIPAGLSAWWDTVVTNVQVAPYVPILGGAGTTATFTQGGAVAPLDAALTVKDVGSSTLAGATIAISGGLLAEDALNFSNQAGIVGNFNATTGVLTLGGTASLAAYQTALESITYSSSSADASGAGADPARTITWTVTDGAQTSTPITTSVDIAAASSVAASFSGISDPTNYPPQNALAVGPQSIVTAESSRYEVTNLTGGAATTGSLFSLFSSLGTTLDNSTYDPRAAYDSSTGRFVLIVNNIQPGGSTNIDIAVSNDSNPTDGWSVASLDTSTGGTTQSDMPDLSVTGTDGNIYLTAPEYPASVFAGTGQWVISESSIVSGSPQVIASQTAPASDAIMRNISGGNGVTYYVSAFSNGSQSELTYETYSAAAGFSGTQTLALGNNDQGPGGTDYTAQQAGTSLTLDAGDSHIQSLAYANGYLYGVSETMPTGASAPDVHWFKLDVSNAASPRVVSQGDLSGSLLGNANIALFNPSIAVDGNGDVLINFTASGPNMNPSDYYMVQGAKDLAFSAPTLYQASTSYFQEAPGATGAQRWGTYSSAVADPNNPNGFWISNEYVTNTGVTIPSGLSAWWDTAVAQVSVGGGPVSVPPTIAGTHATPTASDGAVNPFTGVTIGDPNAGATDTLTITLSNSGTNGVLSGTGLSGGTNGVYTLSGSAATATSVLDALTFTPAKGAPGSITTTTFALSDKSTGFATPATDSATTVTDTDAGVAPTIAGTHATPTASDGAVNPFTGVTIGDPNTGATDTLTITLSNSGTNGVLSGTGLSGGTNGVYTLSGSAATATSVLDALTFTPAKGAPGSITTTTFALSDKSTGFATPATDSATTVTDTDAGVAPTIAGTHATPTASDGAVNPFTGVTIGDPNTGATDTLTITLSNSGTNGVLSGTGLSGGTNGVYTLSGSAATATSVLDALTFTPAKGAPGSITTTTFALSDKSTGFATPATDSATTVTDTDAGVAPTIAGTHATPTASDGAVNPFTGVTIGDPNTGATDTLTITLSNSGTNGVLSGTGLSGGTNGVYTLSGSAATATSVLDALTFTPAKGAPGSITTTTFALSDKSTGFATPATDSATTVTDTDAGVAPTIAGTHATPTASDGAVNPFTGVTIGDPNTGATDTLTITLSNSGTNGVLSGTGLSGGTNGVYTLSGSAATATSVLDALTFTPAKGAPGSITTTTFALSDKSTGFATPATDSATTVTDTDAGVAPTIAGTHATTTASDGAVHLFTGVTIGDPNTGATDTLTITLSNSGTNGVLSGTGLSGGTNGVYTLSGSAATATSVLDALTFTPAKGAPGSITTTTFALSDKSTGFATPATDSATTVTDTDAGVAPTIAGTHATPTASDGAVNPFTGVTIGDPNTGATDTLTITLSNSGTNGVLSGTGLSGGTNGVYTLSGSAATATSVLDALTFTPAKGAPGSITTTTFALSDKSTGFATPATDSATTVTDTDAGVAPTIAGTHATPTASDGAVNPFTGVTIGDPNTGATDTLTITLSNSGTNGVLSGTGLSGGTNGVYTLSGSAATATSVLDALTFTPAKGAPGSITTTTFALSDKSTGFATPATDSATTVTDTDAGVAPTIAGTHATPTASDGAVNPFTGVTIGDPNTGATDTLTITLSNSGTNGVLSGTGLSGGTNGVYTLSGSAATATSVLDALTFTPAKGAPGSITTTTFALSDKSTGFATPATDSATTVTDTDAGVAPTIAGAHATTTTNDAAVHLFTGVTIGDLNAATDTLTITLSNSGTTGKLTGTGLSGGTNGVYTLKDVATTVTSELDLLTFTPVKGAPGSTTTTTFTLSDLSTGFATPVTDSATTVTDIDATVAPTIVGAHATTTLSDAAVTPFSNLTITDVNAGATDTLTITLSNSGTTGKLSGTGLGGGTNGVYTLKGAAGTVTTELDALLFTPAKGTPNTVTTTTFTLSDQSTGFATTVTDRATTVTDTDGAAAPTIVATHATSTTNDAAANPFTGVTIGDLNPGATETLTITLSGGGTTGTLSGKSLSGGTGGIYTLSGTAAAVTSALDTLSFKPATGAPDGVATTFTLSDKSSIYPTAVSDSGTTVTDTDATAATLAITSASYTTSWILGGTAPVGSTVTVLSGATTLGTVVATTGSWTFATKQNNSAIRTFTVSANGVTSGAYIEGTAGNNVFQFASEAALSAAALINGDGGTDTLQLTSAGTLSDADFAHAQAIEILGLTGASSVTLGPNASAAGIKTVTIGNGNTSVTDTNSGALAVNATALPAGSTLTLAGSAADTVTGLTGNLSATGDSGMLTITATGATAQTIATGSGPTTITDNAAGSVTVDATLLGTNTLTLAGSATKTVNNLTGNVVVSGTATITVNATGSGPQSVTTGNGNTTIIDNGGGAMTVNDANAKGSGHTLTLSGTAAETVTSLAQNLVASGLSGNLNVTTTVNGLSITLGTGTNTINARAMTGALTLTGASAATVTAMGGNLKASTDSGALTVTTTGAAQSVTTGSGPITIDDTSTGNLTVNAAALSAGNTLTLMGAGTATVTGLKGNLDATGDSGAISVTATGTGQTVDTGSGNMTIADSTSALTVNAAALSAGNTLTLSGSTAKTVDSLQGNLSWTSGAGPITVTATGSGPQSITTGTGADTIIAETTGGDTIHGGGGADNINVTGHTAADTFTYSATTDSRNTTAGHDTITGFSGSDLLDFSSLNPSLKVGGLEAAGSQIAADSIAWVNLGASGMGVYVNDTTNALATTNTSLMETTLAGVSSLSASNFHA